MTLSDARTKITKVRDIQAGQSAVGAHNNVNFGRLQNGGPDAWGPTLVPIEQYWPTNKGS